MEGMSRTLIRIVLAATILSQVACESTAASAQTQRPQPRSASPVAPASPSTTPRPDEEHAITAAVEAQGARVTRVTADTKFDWLFGSAAPRSGMFEMIFEGQETWINVHFLRRSLGEVVACSGQPGTSLAGTFSIASDGRPQFAAGSTVTGYISSGAMYFAVGDRYFVMTPDLHLRDRLLRALALTAPPCREPIDLAVLPWEQDVLDALRAAGIDITLIGGSRRRTSAPPNSDPRIHRKKRASRRPPRNDSHFEPPTY